MAKKPPAYMVKLRPGVGGAEVFSEVTGVLKITQIFPDSTDEELSTLYHVEVDRSDASAVAECIRKIEQVEYVEEDHPRKLL